MILYLTAKTKAKDVYIDCIEFETPTGTINADWDTSDISRDDEGFTARYKGVYFNDAYANGRLDELKKAKGISYVAVSSESDDDAAVEIVYMEFVDGDRTFVYGGLPYTIR